MADVTSTTAEIDAQRRQALEDMAQLGYRTQVASQRQGDALNSQAQANAAYSTQAAADINAPQALRDSMATQNTFTQGQGAGALNDSRYRDEAYRSATQNENELYFDRLNGLVPLYQQAAAAAAAARGGGGGGGGGGGSTNQGGFLNQGQSADEIQKAGLALADQERGRRKETAVSTNSSAGAKYRGAVAKAARASGVVRNAARNRNLANNRFAESAALAHSGRTPGVMRQATGRGNKQGFLPNPGQMPLNGRSIFQLAAQRHAENTLNRARTQRDTAIAAAQAAVEPMTGAQGNLAVNYNPTAEANWPFSNDRIALAQEQLAAQGYPVDPFAAQAAFAESYFRPIPEQQPQQIPYTDAIRMTPQYAEGSSLIQQAAAQGYSSQYVQQQLNQLDYPPEVLSQLITDQFNILPYDDEYQYEAP